MKANDYLDDKKPSASSFLDSDQPTGFKTKSLAELLSAYGEPNTLNAGAKVVSGLPGVLEVGARRGYAGIGKVEQGALSILGDLLGSQTLSNASEVVGNRARQIENSAVLRGQNQVGFAPESIVNDVPEAGANAVSSVIQTAPSLLAGALAPGAALPTLFGQTFNQEYAQGKDAGLSPLKAAGRAVPMAAFEVAGEKLGGFDRLAEGLRAATRGNGVADLGAAMVSSALKEIPSEEFTTTGQFLTDKAPVIGLNQDATLADYAQQVKDTALTTALQSGAMGAAGRIVQGRNLQAPSVMDNIQPEPMPQAQINTPAIVDAISQAVSNVKPSAAEFLDSDTAEVPNVSQPTQQQPTGVDSVAPGPELNNGTGSPAIEPAQPNANAGSDSAVPNGALPNGDIPDGVAPSEPVASVEQQSSNPLQSPVVKESLTTEQPSNPQQLPKKSKPKANTLLSAIDGLGGIDNKYKWDISGEQKFARGGYNKIFRNASTKTLEQHIENGDLDEFLPYDMRSSVTDDPTAGRDYLADRIRNGDRVLPYDVELEAKQSKVYESDPLQADIESAITDDALDIDTVNALLSEAGYEEREQQTESRYIEAESSNSGGAGQTENTQPGSAAVGIVSDQGRQAGQTARVQQAAQNEVTGTPGSNEREGTRQHVEAIVRRRAAANQLGKLKPFDNALKLAKDFMAGEPVSPAKFKNAATLFANDKPLADAFTALQDMAKQPAKQSHQNTRSAVDIFTEQINNAKTVDELKSIARNIQMETGVLNDAMAQQLDDMVMERIDAIESSGDLLGDNTHQQQAIADAERAKDAKRNAGNDNASDFVLTGSDRPADQAAARGARDLFNGEDNSSFKRDPMLDAIANIKRQQNQAVDQVQAYVDAIAEGWKNAPTIQVVYDMNDERIPEAVRRENDRQLSQGATGQPQGFITRGNVYIVASEMSGEKDVLRTLFHESLGHYGLRGLYNARGLNAALDRVATMRAADVAKKAKQYGLNINNARDRLIAAEEVLAEMAETKPDIGVVKQVIAAIRAWLRENIPYFKNLELSDDEIIRNYLLPARQFVERGGKPVTRGSRAVAMIRGDIGDEEGKVKSRSLTPESAREVRLARLVSAMSNPADKARMQGFIDYMTGKPSKEDQYSKISIVSYQQGRKKGEEKRKQLNGDTWIETEKEKIGSKWIWRVYEEGYLKASGEEKTDNAAYDAIIDARIRLKEEKQPQKDLTSFSRGELPDTITVDGIERPTLNSNGKPFENTVNNANLSSMRLNVKDHGEYLKSVPIHAIESGGGKSIYIDANGNVQLLTQLKFKSISDLQREAELLLQEYFSPLKEKQFVRVSASKDDYEHLINGTHRGSKNHATGISEGGLSVAKIPQPVDGGEYAYIVEGERIGNGSDGEPLLDLKTVKPITKPVKIKKFKEDYQKSLIENLKSLGIDEDDYRALVTGGKVTKDEIPSATGNNGNFDLNDSRIAFQRSTEDQPKRSMLRDELGRFKSPTGIISRHTLNSNGQPIHPTRYGIENFWHWFGDSKVVDAEGKPQIVYHGTNKSQDGDAFKMFNTYASNYGLMGIGGYFTEDPAIASEYTTKGKGESPSVYPVYLKINNPIDMDEEADRDAWIDQFDGIESYHEGGSTNETWYRAAEEMLADEQIPFYEGAEIMQDSLRNMGFDGITHVGGGRHIDSKGVKHRVWIAFDPEQIKSATGNNGNFDHNDSRIAFQRSTEDHPKRSMLRDELGRFKSPTGIIYDKTADIVQTLAQKVAFGQAPKELRTMTRLYKADIQKAMDAASNVVKTMAPMSQLDRALVSDVVEKMVQAGVTPPEHIVNIATGMQNAMDIQTDELVKLGMLSRDSADRWRGKYLPRFYMRENTEGVKAWVGKMLRNSLPVRGIGGNSLKGRGLFEEVNVNEVPKYESLGWEVRDPLWKKNRQGELELVDANKAVTPEKVVVWRDWTPSERAEMGENRDALFRFVMGYTSMQNDIALGRLFDSIAKNQEWTRARASDGYVKVPDSEIPETGGVKRYGNLAGLYVKKEILDHISQYEEASELWKYYRKALSFWKAGKTVLNPVAHVNNVVSNLTMAHFAGVSYWDAHKYVLAIKDLANNAPMVQEAKDRGLMTGDITRAELMSDMPDDIKEMMQMQESAIKRKASTVFNIITFGLSKPMGKAYRFEDDFFKYLIYRDARKNGLSPDDAVDYATRYIFTYDDLPKGARTVRDLAIPFFAYTYKAVPALTHTLFNYPWRFAAPAAAVWGVNAIAYALAAGDDGDDWQTMYEKGNELEAEERDNLPPWMRGRSALGAQKSIRLGTDEKTQLPVYMDVSRMIPGGDIFDVTNQADGVPVPAPIMPSNPVLTTIAAMFWNKDTFTGKEVVDLNDTGKEAAQKRAEWLLRQLSPAVAPTAYHFDRLAEATALMSDKTVETPWKDYTGYGKDGLPVQGKYAVPQTFGIKARPIDLERSAEISKGQDNKEIRSIMAEIRQAARLLDQKAISQREYDRRVNEAEQKIEAIENK